MDEAFFQDNAYLASYLSTYLPELSAGRPFLPFPEYGTLKGQGGEWVR